MEEYFDQSGRQLQTQKGDTFLPRGYDPLREIYHWNLIIFLLLGEMIVAGIALIPEINTISFLSSQVWNIKIGIGMILLFLLAVIARSPSIFLRYRREKQKRNLLRQGALIGNYQLLTPIQPPAVPATLSLSIHLESRLKKRFVRGTLIVALLVLLLLVLDLISLLDNSWQIPSFLGTFLSFFNELMLIAMIGIAYALQVHVAGHYLHPSLRVDNEGMSARYGRETISIAWKDVRYFALVNGTTFSKLLSFSASEREAFEISDGENMICWLIASPFSSHNLLWPGETILSAQDYSSLTQQLASLIVAKTNCPLLDFRLPRHKKQAEHHLKRNGSQGL